MAASTINSQGVKPVAPSRSNNAGQFAHFCDLYHQRLDALTLTKQLIHMIKAVQRHRGMTMGTLGGNQQFREDLNSLQVQLERRLELLQAFSAHSINLLSPRDQDNLNNAWLTISRNWQEDSVIDNYELHCHLIEQLLSMVAALGKQLELPTSQSMPDTVEPRVIHVDDALYPNRFKYLEVLHFATRLMPAVAEQIGRIRALATYAAALGYCDKDFAGKLRYVIQCTRVNNEKLRHQTKRLEGLLDTDLTLLNQLKSYEIKLEFLLSMVEADVVNSHQMNADSNRLFSLATDIIDVYLKVVDEGVQLLTQWHEQDIEVWVQSY
ncbi:hypothetical protein [Cellvibrio mixtus]|uniref:hypothetical protein n=1 Tax=Cellvibrio mixtus TaxID=39650 RepID=UPI0005866DEF|nr:hypothetical protein [Cellvibrio mixtus]